MKLRYLVVFILLILISGCRVMTPREIVAPGCIDGEALGGCFGKAAIKNLKIEPEIPACLQIGENNCNGGIISIWNECDKDLQIGNLILEKPKRNGEQSIELFRDSLGNIMVRETKGNFASYTPLEDELLTTTGKIIDFGFGSGKFTISYIKTKPLC